MYVYSAALLRQRYRELDEAFGDYPHAIHYAFKANSIRALVSELRAIGSSVDAVSIWEVELARSVGFEPRRDRVRRRGQVRRRARARGGAGPQGDQRRIDRRAGARGSHCGAHRTRGQSGDSHQPRHRRQEPSAHLDRTQNQQVRHPGWTRRARCCRRSRRGARCSWWRFTCTSAPRSPASNRSGARRAPRRDWPTTRGRPASRSNIVDAGGGLGISYDGGAVPRFATTHRRWLSELRATRLPIVVEPGRSIVGPAGGAPGARPRPQTADVVERVRHHRRRHVRVAEAGLYDAFHRIEPVISR